MNNLDITKKMVEAKKLETSVVATVDVGALGDARKELVPERDQSSTTVAPAKLSQQEPTRKKTAPMQLVSPSAISAAAVILQPQPSSLSNVEGAEDSREERLPVHSYRDDRRRPQQDRTTITTASEREQSYVSPRPRKRSPSPTRRNDRYDGGRDQSMNRYRGRSRSPRGQYLEYDRTDRYDPRNDDSRRRPSGHFDVEGLGNSFGSVLNYGTLDPRGQSAHYSRPQHGGYGGSSSSEMGMGMGRGRIYDFHNTGSDFLQPPSSDSYIRPRPSNYGYVQQALVPSDAGPAPNFASSIRTASLLGSRVHHGWNTIYVHTAKCDKCDENKKNVLQSCVECKLHLCKKCIDKGILTRDPRHEEPAGGFDWSVPAGPVSSKKRVKEKQGGSAQKKPRRGATQDPETTEQAAMDTSGHNNSDEDDPDIQKALLASTQLAQQGNQYQPVKLLPPAGSSRPAGVSGATSSSRPATSSGPAPSSRSAVFPTVEELDLGRVTSFGDIMKMLQKASDVPLDSVERQQFDFDRAKAFRDDPRLRTIVEVEQNPEKAKVFLESAALIMRVIMANKKVRDAE